MPFLLYQDADLVAVAKPSGEPVVPAAAGPREACLHHRIERELGERLWVVHRIDRDASGVVIFARHAGAHRALSLAFERRDTEKIYLAFAAGALDPGDGVFTAPLHAARRGRTRPARPGEPGAREATTTYRVLRWWRHDAHIVSLVELRPRTGRHHQIRVHLRAAGAPILFDRVYGRGVGGEAFEAAPCRRLALHALRLIVPRLPGLKPCATGEGATVLTLTLEAPLAADLADLAAWLDAAWRAGSAAS